MLRRFIGCHQTIRDLLNENVYVGSGLPAMNDDAIFLTYRIDCIAGKPPPTVRCLLRDSATPMDRSGLPQSFVSCKSAAGQT